MNNNLQQFNFNNNTIRTIEDKQGAIYFIASDVCKILEHTNTTKALQSVDKEDKSNFELGLSGGKTNVINESGLYTLLLRSNKPQAKPFKRWVTNDVLPTIRQTGVYSVKKSTQEMNTLELLETAAAEIKLTEERNAQLTDVLLTYQKYGTSLLVRDFIKIAYTENKIEIREQEMWKFLRKTYLDKNDMPYARYREYFEVIYRYVGKNKTILRPTTKISPRGVNYFINKLLETAL